MSIDLLQTHTTGRQAQVGQSACRACAGGCSGQHSTHMGRPAEPAYPAHAAPSRPVGPSRLMVWCTTKRTCGLLIPMPNAIVAQMTCAQRDGRAWKLAASVQRMLRCKLAQSGVRAEPGCSGCAAAPALPAAPAAGPGSTAGARSPAPPGPGQRGTPRTKCPPRAVPAQTRPPPVMSGGCEPLSPRISSRQRA